jgi:hypothetical protein
MGASRPTPSAVDIVREDGAMNECSRHAPRADWGEPQRKEWIVVASDPDNPLRRAGELECRLSVATRLG